MLDMSVTLIVKAPNQQIEDQTIKCEPTWTIKKLKGYLSEVYPSKPRTEDQKLIYSGQLLPDGVVLRDILRWYEGQEAHTVHLVCTPPRDCPRRGSPRPQIKTSERRNSNTTGESSSSISSVNRAAESVSSDGLRQRLVAGEGSRAQTPVADSHLPAPDSAAWAAAMAQPYAAVYDPNNMMQQLAMMHQLYTQYITQYMQMMASGAAMPPFSPPPPGIPPQAVTEQPAAPMNNQDQAEPANEVNVVEGDEEGRANRDWLDWFYFLSRLMVLFSIVYFYSSPTRFIIVSALAIMMYLYQVGFFRIQQQQQRQQQNRQPQPVQPQQARQQQPLPLQVMPFEGQPNDNDVDNNEGEALERGNDVEEPAAEPDRPSLLAITWTFFSSFFASLIPEQPGAL